MVFVEVFAGHEEMRPGRVLFLRKLFISSSSDDSNNKPSLQLILVHGTCATEKQYQLFLEALERQLVLAAAKDPELRLLCLLYDKVGCGQSPPIDDWDAYENTQDQADLQALLEQHTDPLLPKVLVGHSYAPNVFLPFLKKNPLPQLVGCVFICTGLRSEHMPLRDGGHYIMQLPVPILSCLQKQLTEGFVQMAVHPDHVELKDAIRNDSNGNNMATAKAYHCHMRFAKPDDCFDDNGNSVPSLIIHGAEDGIIPVECGQHLANELVPNSQLVIVERASHLVMLEQPEHVAAAVLSFLRQILSTS